MKSFNPIIRSAISSIAFAAADANKGGDAAKSVGDQVKDQQAATSQAVAPAFNGSVPTVTIGGRTFKPKQITRNVFPQRDGQTLFVKIVGKVYQGKELANAPASDKKEPPHLAEVSNLETGELGLMIVNKVLAGELAEKYPKDGYVGKEFAITMKPVEGKRYKQFILFELEADKG